MKPNSTFINRYAIMIYLVLVLGISLAIPLLLPLPTELVPLMMILVPALLAILLTSLGEGKKGKEPAAKETILAVKE